MRLLFLIAAIVLFLIAAFIYWPAHAAVLLCVGLAAFAAAFLPFGDISR